MALLVVNYHYVRSPGPLRLRGLDPIAFRRQLDLLLKIGRPASPADLWAAALGDRARLHEGDRFLLTFDDGLLDHVETVAPELERRGIRAFFFVTTLPWEGRLLDVHRVHLLLGAHSPELLLRAALEELGGDQRLDEEGARRQYAHEDADGARFKYLINFQLTPALRGPLLDRLFERLLGSEADWVERVYLGADDVRRLKEAGHEVGLHSHAHRVLSALPSEEMGRDLGENLTRLEAATGVRPWAIAYPYGTAAAVSKQVVDTAAAVGMKVGFTMRPGVVDPGDDLLLLPRIDTNDAPGGFGPSVSPLPAGTVWGERR